jgi:YbgC/YbaW family acyl-CoA thioester hydrolase
MERGRNEYLRELGRSIRQYQDEGVLFIVVEVNVKYRSPAGLDDDLVVETWIAEGRRSSVAFGQRIKREGEDTVLVEGTVKVACIGSNLRPRRLPQELLDVIQN